MFDLLVLSGSEDTRWMYKLTRNPYQRGRLCMFDLLVLTKLTGNPQQRGKLCKLDLLVLTGSGDTIYGCIN